MHNWAAIRTAIANGIGRRLSKVHCEPKAEAPLRGGCDRSNRYPMLRDSNTPQKLAARNAEHNSPQSINADNFHCRDCLDTAAPCDPRAARAAECMRCSGIVCTLPVPLLVVHHVSQLINDKYLRYQALDCSGHGGPRPVSSQALYQQASKVLCNTRDPNLRK